MRFHFDLIAPLYDRLLPRADPELWGELLQPPVRRILDAGGGTGRVGFSLRPWARQVVVSDISHRMLLRALRKDGLEPVEADVLRLPFPDGVFDRVIVADSFHHFPQQEEALREILRVLEPDGRLIIEEPDLARLAVKGVAAAEKALLMQSRFLSPEAICRMAASRGARVRIARRERFMAWLVVTKGRPGEGDGQEVV